jgi:hypothetical protein
MKETEEEEIFKKVKDELSKHPIKLPPFDHMKAFAKLYHQERLKSSLPSEDEISLIERLKQYIKNKESYKYQEKLKQEAAAVGAYEKAAIHQKAMARISSEMNSIQLIRDVLTLLTKEDR